MAKGSKVNTGDPYRVLLTETLPYELPVIFDNEGLYNFYREFEGEKVAAAAVDTVPSILKKALNLNNDDKEQKSIPYMYQISKGFDSYRELYVVHPSNQRMFVDFYENYKDLILYCVNKSKFSLRYPKRISSSVYKNSNNDKFYEILTGGSVDVAGEDLYDKFSSTYFAYKKYNLLYKFFESTDFLRLEKNYRFMTSMDVSRCFDSIYTHSVSWAVKNKGYVKSNLFPGAGYYGFDDEFDKIIRSGNDNETNGIVIGPEYSRIFAEIIFQRIDLNIYNSLESEGLKSGVDYSIKRYVDDIYIFSKNKDVEALVFETSVKELWKFKFRINESKTLRKERPYVTPRSKGIIELRSRMNDLLDNGFEKIKYDDVTIYKPKPLRNYHKVSTVYIKNIKSCWYSLDSSGGSFSNYVISSFLNQMQKTVLGYHKYVEMEEDVNKKEIYLNDIVSWFLLAIEVSSYCYLLSQKVSESFKFSQLLVEIKKFVAINSLGSIDLVEHKIYEVVNYIIQDELTLDKPCGIETLNLLIVLSEVSGSYQIEESKLIDIIYGKSDESSYFSIITALYIANRSLECTKLISRSLDYAKKIFLSKPSILKSSEALHLYLDMMACPLFARRERVLLTKLVLERAGVSCGNRPSTELSDFCHSRTWFTSWGNVDLMKSLFRKLLKKVY